MGSVLVEAHVSKNDPVLGDGMVEPGYARVSSLKPGRTSANNSWDFANDQHVLVSDTGSMSFKSIDEAISNRDEREDEESYEVIFYVYPGMLST